MSTKYFRIEDWTQAVLTADTDSKTRLVALTLARHADAHGKARLSYAELADQTALGERSVTTALGALRRGGWLAKTAQGGGRSGRTGNEYLIVMPETAA